MTYRALQAFNIVFWPCIIIRGNNPNARGRYWQRVQGQNEDECTRPEPARVYVYLK